MISYEKDSYDFDEILNIIKKNSETVILRRYTVNSDGVESVLFLNISSFKKMQILQSKLSSLFPKIEFDFVDSEFS